MDSKDIKQALSELRAKTRADPHMRDGSSMLQVRAIAYLTYAVLEVAAAIRENKDK